MYYSLSQSNTQSNDALLGLAPREFVAHLVDEPLVHIPFESVVVAITREKPMVPEVAAREIVAHDAGYRSKALRVGADVLMKSLGGEEPAMRFFRSVLSERSALRFESYAEGVTDNVVALKNRVAAAAAMCYDERQEASQPGLLPIERNYVDLMKSIRLCLERGVEEHVVTPELAQDVMIEVEGAALGVGFDGMKEVIGPLHEMAANELFETRMAALRERYTTAPSPEEPSGP
ncbi:hypothetical protein [Pandoraea communis]|uniref:hypothetical protein n=1 Tax=Pandoraea communis TaxID=2508297 RepID=UPI0025A5F673|nr:hypothetical protein [Pandoraea communis]MDM8356545.1 hypothetical protein [Pandoraea communis]